MASAQIPATDPNMQPLRPLPKYSYYPKPPPINPWLLDFLAFTDLNQKPSLSRQWEELRFGYTFDQEVSFYLDWGYSGLLSPKNSTDAEIWDPEFLLQFTIPLSSKRSPSEWDLLLGTSLVLPASVDSVSNNMLAGFSAMAGFQWKKGKWTLTNWNRAYVYAYQYQPSTLPDPNSGDASDGPATTTPVQSKSLTYVFTAQRLRLMYDYNDKISGKVETWYNMSFSGGPLPAEYLQIFSTVGYYLTPHFRVFTGFTTFTEVDQAAKPSLFTADATGFRLGFYLKW